MIDAVGGPARADAGASLPVRARCAGDAPPSGSVDGIDDAAAPGGLDGTVEAMTRHVQLAMLAQEAAVEQQRLALERMRSAFDYKAQLTAEYQRERNLLRDLAAEQRKKDDEFVKKMISLI